MTDPTPRAGARPSGQSKASGLRRLLRPSYAPVAPLAEGSMIAGKYRVLGRIGEGGMGAVYRAEHVAMRRLVAVKVMRAECATDPAMADRFEREAQASSRIQSPHVITIHDFGLAEDGLLYLVMELLHGASLAERLDAQIVFPWRPAVEVAIGMARALEAAHRAGVVHRDVKPDNVFLCEDGAIKLLDFGIARIVTSASEPPIGKNLTQAGMVLGTALYMSPEAVAHEPIGPAADLYALGAILFEMLTGRLLFEEEQPVLLMGMHLRMPPDRVREVRPDLAIPEALDDLVDRLLAKAPDDRPASASELAAALEASLATTDASGPISVPALPSDPDDEPTTQDVSFPRADAPPRASRRWMAVGAVLGVVLIVGVSLYVARTDEVDARPQRSVRIAADAPRDTARSTDVPRPSRATPPVTIRFVTTPSSARVVSQRGLTLRDGSIALARDGREHVFRVEAAGYTPATVRVTTDRDRTATVELHRAPTNRSARPRRSASERPELGPPRTSRGRTDVIDEM